jgi:hypothetical protein
MQCKTEEPTHARFATLGIRRKDAVPADPFEITDFKSSRVDEADARAGSIAALSISQHRDQRHKAGIADQTRKFDGQMHLNVFGVRGLKLSIV